MKQAPAALLPAGQNWINIRLDNRPESKIYFYTRRQLAGCLAYPEIRITVLFDIRL